MPPRSQAQRRWAFAAAAGKIPGVKPSVGVEFEGPGIKGLPERISKPKPYQKPSLTRRD
jgi:hypothetical protein